MMRSKECVRVRIDYMDGRYTFRRISELAAPHQYDIEVDESTVAMWEAILRLDRDMQGQLMSMDNDRILSNE